MKYFVIHEYTLAIQMFLYSLCAYTPLPIFGFESLIS